MSFVPRLSLIVPFQRDEAALETTLVSVLESRTSEDELIIVHAGDYDDPYQLAGDEAVVLETEGGSSLAVRLNLAARASCSPLVQVVLPGTKFEPGWCDEGLESLEDGSVHAVAMPVVDPSTQRVAYGLDQEALPHRRIAFQSDRVAGPALSGTLIRRRSLLKLGGWSELIADSLLDLELALLMRSLGLRSNVVETACMFRDHKALSIAPSPFETGKGCGQLACAYSELPESQIVVEPLVRRLGMLACGLMNPHVAAERLGWVLGVRDRSLVRYIAQRVEFSSHAFQTSATLPLPMQDAMQVAPKRRAA